MILTNPVWHICREFLKTATLGYDGKGQIRVHTLTELREAFQTHGGVPCVLEKIGGFAS